MGTSYDIKLPMISGQDPATQIAEMKSYLFQMVQQLNWALNTIESSSSQENTAIEVVGGTQLSEPEAQATFNSIKSLIIKSADIVTAYYERFNQEFSGLYVAQSDFGTFSEETNAKIEESSKAIEQNYTDIQSIESDVVGVGNAIREVNAHIKTGLLDYDSDGNAIYGVEVGQRNVDEEGVESFNKYARFTADRLAFYDQNGNEVSYISDYKLFITNAVITGNMWLGGYILDTSDGIAFKWVGG